MRKIALIITMLLFSGCASDAKRVGFENHNRSSSSLTLGSPDFLRWQQGNGPF